MVKGSWEVFEFISVIYVLKRSLKKAGIKNDKLRYTVKMICADSGGAELDNTSVEYNLLDPERMKQSIKRCEWS